MPIWNERILLVLYVDYSQIPKWIDDMIIVSWKYEIRNDICLAKKKKPLPETKQAVSKSKMLVLKMTITLPNWTRSFLYVLNPTGCFLRNVGNGAIIRTHRAPRFENYSTRCSAAI